MSTLSEKIREEKNDSPLFAANKCDDGLFMYRASVNLRDEVTHKHSATSGDLHLFAEHGACVPVAIYIIMVTGYTCIKGEGEGQKEWEGQKIGGGTERGGQGEERER